MWLAEHDVCDDVLMGYPSVDRPAPARLAGRDRAVSRVALMVDSAEYLDPVDGVQPAGGPPVRVAVDVDAGLHAGHAHLGPRRSPLLKAGQVVALVQEILRRPGFELAGVTTYEGQVAGVPDDVPRHPVRSAAVRRVKLAPVARLTRHMAEVATALRDLCEVPPWNAGGAGSLETSAADPVVTEVTAGSGLLVPHPFDHYRSFEPRPAAFFGLRVVRRPAPGLVTVAGGGLIATGPSGHDRAPLPWASPGLALTALEGAGEVQTPLRGPGTGVLTVGDLVWFRHAKSGGPAEHTASVHLLAGTRVRETVPTYRARGRCG